MVNCNYVKDKTGSRYKNAQVNICLKVLLETKIGELNAMGEKACWG